MDGRWQYPSCIHCEQHHRPEPPGNRALGRRFRALKLWFVMRYFGRESLAATLREKLRMAVWLGQKISADDRFDLLAPAALGLVCFRHRRIRLQGRRVDAHPLPLQQSVFRQQRQHPREHLTMRVDVDQAPGP